MITHGANNLVFASSRCHGCNHCLIATTTVAPQDEMQQSEIRDGNVLEGCVAILVRPSGPINLGLIARTAANLGITRLRIVNPQVEINCSDARRLLLLLRFVTLCCLRRNRASIS
jgi:hypothetical protein